MDVAGADKPGAELRVRDAFTGATLRAAADEWGEPERVELWTPEEYIRLDEACTGQRLTLPWRARAGRYGRSRAPAECERSLRVCASWLPPPR
jgi:hypothetical protein